MIEKFKRKKINKADIVKPKTVDDIVRMYDLDNSDIIEYLDYLVDKLNENE